jgi:uncharacterized membrane protein
VLPTLTVDERREVQKSIYRGARPRTDFLLMIAFSAAIAAMGLLLDSPAVIIGAMLVAPLMSAIVGVGLGVILGGAELVRKALWTSFQGMLLAIAVGAQMCRPRWRGWRLPRPWCPPWRWWVLASP